MTITIAPARNEYTANAGQTIFNYTFKIFENTDLNVYVTPAGQVADDSTDLTTSYTVTNLGDEDGGTVILSTPTSSNDLVTIVSDIPSERTTDYQNNGDFRPDVVNSDFDRVVSIAKKIEDNSNRSVLLEQSQQGSKPLSLPVPVPLSQLRWRADALGLENFNPAVIPESLEVRTESITITPQQTIIQVYSKPISLTLIINGETQEQTTSQLEPKAFTYNNVDGVITLAEPLKGNEAVFVNYGAIVSLTVNVNGGALYRSTALSAVADLELIPGNNVITGGYTSIADGGESSYTVKTKVQHGGEPDGRKDLLLDNGNVLASNEFVVNVVQMGAVANDVLFDNSSIVIACAQANPDGIARLTLGEFYFNDPIIYPDDFRGIIGKSKEGSELHWLKTNEGDYGFRAENPSSCKLYHLEKFTIRGTSFDDGQLLCKIDRIQYGIMKDIIFNAAHVLCDLNDFSFALNISTCRFGGLDGQAPVTGSIGLILRQNPNGVSLNRCDFYRMDLAVEARQSFSTNFTGGCVFENCNRAFDFYNTQKLVISGNYFENIYDTHFTFKGSSITPKVMVEDNYFVFSETGETNAIVKVDGGATNSKQLVMTGNNFRLQNENVLTSGYIIDITGAGSPLFVWWWNNDIYSSNLATPLAEAHNMDSPRFIGDIPSYKINLSSDWDVYEEGVLLNAGPLRVYMDDKTRKPFIKQDIKYVGASGTNAAFTLAVLPSAFENNGTQSGLPIMTHDNTDFGIGKSRLVNGSEVEILRGTIANLSNKVFQVDMQWANEFNRIDPEGR